MLIHGYAYLVRWAAVLVVLGDIMDREGVPRWERVTATIVIWSAVMVGLLWPLRKQGRQP